MAVRRAHWPSRAGPGLVRPGRDRPGCLARPRPDPGRRRAGRPVPVARLRGGPRSDRATPPVRRGEGPARSCLRVAGRGRGADRESVVDRGPRVPPWPAPAAPARPGAITEDLDWADRLARRIPGEWGMIPPRRAIPSRRYLSLCGAAPAAPFEQARKGAGGSLLVCGRQSRRRPTLLQGSRWPIPRRRRALVLGGGGRGRGAARPWGAASSRSRSPGRARSS